MTQTVGVVASGAGGAEVIRTKLVEPLLASGHQVTVTLTPTAAWWLDAVGEVDRLADVTGWPVRSQGRLPSEPSPHPSARVFDVLTGYERATATESGDTRLERPRRPVPYR
ncbi:MAG TPA: hypothetical protein VEK80_04400 [Kribbellaceae bacterium]|nr:hypothetical protein [Kribbellaceae bacterium]